jgi:hypothetical protein
MGVEDKDRVSGELPRSAEQAEPMLPTTNPVAKQPEPPRFSLHPAFYVMYVTEICPLHLNPLQVMNDLEGPNADVAQMQRLDRLQLWCDCV